MNAIKTFNRYEEKYIMTEEQKERMQKFLSKYFVSDHYCVSGFGYPIYNIYFDGVDHPILRQSVQKPPFKEKMRMRSYHCPVSDMDNVFLEIKRKVNGRINKRRICLTYHDAMTMIENGKYPHYPDYESNQVLAEIRYFLEMNPVKASYFISYERLAYTSIDQSGIRITFDRNLRERTWNLNLNDNAGTLLLPKEQWLMEIKTSDNYPLWLVEELSALGLYSQSFSKVGSAYQLEVRGEKSYV